jgi:hypothetical protein
MRRNLARLVGKTARIGRLTAAGLFFRKMDTDAFTFEQGNGVETGAGKELIDNAGGEEIDVALGAGGFLLVRSFCLRW